MTQSQQTAATLRDEVQQAVDTGPHRMRIGLRPLADEDWIAPQSDFDAQLRAREAILSTQDDVIIATEGSIDAQAELLALVADHVTRYLPAHYTREGDSIHVHATGRRWPLSCADPSALRVLAALIPDDVCILSPNSSGQYIMTAAAVCFPTRWKLRPKMGRTLMDIHGPVPEYASRIGAAMDRLFESLAVERPLWRTNWSLLDSPALFQPVRPDRPGQALTSSTIGASVWLRSERQTLRRLPRTQDIVFTIRIRQVSLDEACQDPLTVKRLQTQLSTMFDALQHYKGVHSLRPAIDEYLRARSHE
ncbi:MAG: DUF3445 domain-containing protein [Gammaproteobacteria bacterium]|nr:DUF3445 domain-containing protein [Gammaproteobacteria bacterium]